MEREFFSIEQAVNGWVVHGAPGMADEGPDPTPRIALEHASALAYRRHLSTGHPTGVKLRLECGDTVLFAAHG